MRSFARAVAMFSICSITRVAVAQTTDPEPKSESTWFADASAGLPRLRSSSDFNVVGDLSAGWATPRFGVLASGAAHSFALDSGDTHSDLDAYSGSLEGYFRAGSDDAALELRAEFGASLYDTTFIQVPAGSVAFHDQTSVLYRGALLVGGALKVQDRLRLHALVGGGIQDEEYNAASATSSSSGTNASIQDVSRIAARGEARLEAHWFALPGLASLRLRTEAQLYSLTRSAEVISLVGGQVSSSSSTDTLRQLETSTRLFVHFDALAFVDIVPSVFGGVDALFVSANGGSKSDVVPVVGLGLLKLGP